MRVLSSVLLSCVLLSAKADQEKCQGNLCSKVSGKSGKITISRSDIPDSAVTLTMDSMIERGADGVTEVGRAGSAKHSFNSFATQDFAFSAWKNVTVNEVPASELTFDSTISAVSANAKLSVSLLLFQGNGTVVNDDEELEVKEGEAKFNVKLEGWAFCDSSCKEGAGAFIDLTIDAKGKDAAPKNATEPATSDEKAPLPTLSLGGGASLVLSNKVKVDDKWQAMPAGYPKAEGTKVTLRFPKFVSSVFYDPLVSFDSDAQAPAEPEASSANAALLSLAALVAGLVVA